LLRQNFINDQVLYLIPLPAGLMHHLYLVGALNCIAHMDHISYQII